MFQEWHRAHTDCAASQDMSVCSHAKNSVFRMVDDRARVLRISLGIHSQARRKVGGIFAPELLGLCVTKSSWKKKGAY